MPKWRKKQAKKLEEVVRTYLLGVTKVEMTEEKSSKKKKSKMPFRHILTLIKPFT